MAYNITQTINRYMVNQNTDGIDLLFDGNTVAWFNYEDHVIEDVGVSIWKDKSGNSNNLIQESDDAQPTLTETGILFDGINDLLISSFTLNQPISTYIVVKIIDWESTPYIISGRGSGNTGGSIRMYSVIPQINLDWPATGNENSNQSEYMIIRSVYNSDNSTLQVGVYPITTFDANTKNAGGITLGASNLGALFSNIEVKSLIIRNIVDSEADSNSIYDYLNTKYNTDNNIISVIGDSISIYRRWPAYLSSITHALSGATILSNMASQVVSAANDNANIIIMALGSNDNNNGDMSALQTIVENGILDLKISNPRAEIYYMNVLPRWLDAEGTELREQGNLRNMIAAACQSQNIECWDTFSDPWITIDDLEDGVHPTDAGSLKICNRIKALI